MGASTPINRRTLLGGATGAALAAGGVVSAGSAAGAVELQGTTQATVTHDVVVIGAGLAGLSAATSLATAGHDVVVLEARDRVGGRNLDLQIAPGKIVEMGGQWVGPGQNHVLALIKSLGLETFPTYATGKSLYYRNGSVRQYSGSVPPASLLSLLEVQAAANRINQIAKNVPPDHPWQASDAASLDAGTVDRFITDQCQSDEARTLMRLAVRGVYGDDAPQVSLLDLLAQTAGVGGDVMTLFGSAQSLRIVGGPQQMSRRLAARLGTRVRLNTAVSSVRRSSAATTITTSNGTFQARAVIVAVPKTTMGAIRFDPQLPPALTQLLQRQPTGATIKVNVVYDRPFWRAQGLSGSVVSDQGPIEIVYDNSPVDGSPGVLVGFMEGHFGRAAFNLSTAQRRQQALDCLVRYFGTPAATPLAYHELVWARERYTGGAYGSFNPPGVLTGVAAYVGDAGNGLYFAGADTASAWPGYMDGAISTGQQVAAQVAHTL
jgi:monoamine oxidase